MATTTSYRRQIEVHDNRAGSLFQRLETFLGRERIDKRLRSLRHALEVESGTYREYWLVPNSEWWLALGDALDLVRYGKSLRGTITPTIRIPLETAAKLSALYHTMTAQKRHEFRQRLLAADDVKPITLEIDIAAHYWQQGAQISWSDSGVIHNKRSPEFTATIGDQQIEVECKAKGVTAGRRVTRPAFYRLVDMLTVRLRDACLTGRVHFTCAERLPTNPKWILAAIDQLEGRFCVGDQEFSLADGTRVGLTLQPSTGAPVDVQAIEQTLTNLRTTFGHAAMVVTKNGDNFVDPILVFAQSERPDRLLDDILQDLRDKQQQFSGG